MSRSTRSAPGQKSGSLTDKVKALQKICILSFDVPGDNTTGLTMDARDYGVNLQKPARFAFLAEVTARGTFGRSG